MPGVPLGSSAGTLLQLMLVRKSHQGEVELGT